MQKQHEAHPKCTNARQYSIACRQKPDSCSGDSALLRFLAYAISTKTIHFRIKNNAIRKTTNNKRNSLDLEWRSFAHHYLSHIRH
ncbi:hypothetical protein, partial [Comamonas sp.]|uniref:hypothetical protein n=1 Tax=Comamonas sp. TaxID=34028 RepID=UPI002FC755C2